MKKIEYYKNGVVRAIYNLDKNEDFHGRVITFHENGRIDTVCRYEHGKQTGREVSFHNNGRLCRKCTFKNDKLEGRMEEYSYNGKKARDCFFRGGMIDGVCEIFYSDGSVYKRSIYSDGVEMKILEHNELPIRLNMY